MKRQSKMVGEDPIITMEDVKDLVHMKGRRLDKLAAVLARANQKLEAAAPPPSKKRNSHAEGEASSSASKKKKTNPRSNEPLPPLPPEFQRAIEDRARGRTVTAPIPVIQKKLFKTDVAANNNRLSIPISKIDDNFLTAEEKRTTKVVIKVDMLAPSLEWVEGVKLNRWDMPKDNGSKTSSIYAINGAWNDVVRKNELKEGTEVQLWCFRLDQNLHFALVRLN